MKVALAADHAGFALEEVLRRHLASRGHQVLDPGARLDARERRRRRIEKLQRIEERWAREN